VEHDRIPAVEALGRQGLDWLLGQARASHGGLAWPARPGDDGVAFSLYQGTAGVVLAMLEGQRHFGDDRYGDAALRGARAVAGAIDDGADSSLYSGLSGFAFVLNAVADVLGDNDSRVAATRALAVVREEFDGRRWGEFFELLLGNAGIATAALACGDVDLAVRAVEPYVDAAEPTTRGVQWEPRQDSTYRMHHFSHGTLGVAYALAAVGDAAGRADLTELALAGVADVLPRNEDAPDGFLVPHSDPPHPNDLTPRYSYGWCHGPAGDAQTFRLLAALTKDPQWTALVESCWHTIAASGLPQRLEPGFWDNNGRCCGTASVLSLACDRRADTAADLDFAHVLAADLLQHATVDDRGARWSNVEHRATPSRLEPHTGWGQGNAGIVRELLRYVRAATDRDPRHAAPLPDHPSADRAA
jgi:lantibiotic modifying enzyme